MASNVMVICPKCSKPSRIGHKSTTDSVTGKKHTMRVCRNCEEMF